MHSCRSRFPYHAQVASGTAAKGVWCCRCSEASDMLQNINTLLEEAVFRHQGKGSSMQAQAELSRVMLWFASQSRARNDVQLSHQVCTGLDRVLAVKATRASFLAVLCKRLVSLEACGGAVVAAAVVLVCSGSQTLLSLVCLVCVLAYYKNNISHQQG